MIGGLKLTQLGLGLTDLKTGGADQGADPNEPRNQILMTYTYTLHSANAFPGLLPPPSF